MKRSVDLMTATLAATLALVSTAATAAPRALIMGVGEYARLDADLIGIDVDMEMMTEVAINLGFAEEEIKVLHDAEATYANIEAAMTTWIRDGVTENDHVLIYFSGHGSRVPDADGDEDDGVDEVLLTHDAFLRRDLQPGEPRFGNIVLDDQIAEWLAAIPSRNVIVFLDSCYSGSATRSFPLRNRSVGADFGQLKFLHYEGVPRSADGEPSFTDEASSNYAGLSASRGDQPSITTISGGYFTQGVWRAVKSAIRDPVPLTMEDLRVAATAFVDSRMDEDRMHHPTLSGNPGLISRPLPLVGVPSGHGPRWRRIEALAAEAEPLPVSTATPSYALGDEIEIAVEIPVAGFLNVISIDASDRATVLFPNRYSPSNAVDSGRMTIPTPEMQFALNAAEPVGPALIIALLTNEPINAYELGVEGRDEGGVMQEVYTELSPRAALSLRDARSQPTATFRAGLVTVSINR